MRGGRRNENALSYENPPWSKYQQIIIIIMITQSNKWMCSCTYLNIHITMNFRQCSFWQAAAKMQTITVLRNNMFKYPCFVQLPEGHVSKCGFGLCQVMKTEKKHKTEIVDATYRFRAAIAKSQRQQNNINWWCDVTSNSKVPELNLVARYAAHERVLSKRHNSQLVLNSTLLREALILSQSRQKHHFCRCVC